MNPTWLLIFVVWIHTAGTHQDYVKTRTITTQSYDDCQKAIPLITKFLYTPEELEQLKKEKEVIDKVKVLPCLEVEP